MIFSFRKHGLRVDRHLVKAEKRCIYCGSEDDLHREHIVVGFATFAHAVFISALFFHADL